MSPASPPWSGKVKHRGAITVSIMLATIMQALDTTIANVALPHMQGSFGVAQDQIAWVLTSYIVAAAVATPLTGWLAASYGRKRLFLASVAGFTAASLLCGAAGSIAQIVVFRLLQGVFGAALVPLSQAVLLDINPREKHGSAMAIWGAGIMLGPILGPTLGGWLTDQYNWRWVFYINLPVGILAFCGILAFVSETTRRSRPFDFFGFAMLSLGVGALQMMLDRGQLKDWLSSREIAIELGLAITGFWVFIVHAATAEHPFVNLKLFRDRNFAAGQVLMFVVGIVLYATMALLPPMLQELFNYPVITTGWLMTPRGITTMLAMLIVGRLSGRVDARLLMAFGFCLTAYSLWVSTSWSLEMDMWPIIIVGALQGFGMGFLFVPLSTSTFATLSPQFRTEATSLYSLVRNVAGSIGISIAETFLSRYTQINHSSLATDVTPYSQALQQPGVQQLWNLHSATGMAALDLEVNRQAMMIAYVDDFMLMMVITLAAIPLLLLLRKAAAAPAAMPVAE
jgi:DHA2 family multidrug resistance protein